MGTLQSLSAPRHGVIAPVSSARGPLHLCALSADAANQKQQDIETGLAEKVADGEPKPKPGLKRTATRLLKNLQAHKEEPQKGHLVRPFLLVAADSNNMLPVKGCTRWPGASAACLFWGAVQA